MGWEAACHVTLPDGTERATRILLESSEVIIPGRPRLRIARKDMASIQRSGAVVRITLPRSDRLALAFPAAVDAERFLARLAAPPRTRVDKLGAEAGCRCLLAGRFDPPLAKELEVATGVAPATRVPRLGATPSTDGRFGLVIARVDSPSDQATLARLATHLSDGGACWVAWPKGRGSIDHEDVVDWCSRLGLSPTRSMSLNDELTALRFVRRRTTKPAPAAEARRSAKQPTSGSNAGRARRL